MYKSQRTGVFNIVCRIGWCEHGKNAEPLSDLHGINFMN